MRTASYSILCFASAIFAFIGLIDGFINRELRWHIITQTQIARLRTVQCQQRHGEQDISLPHPSELSRRTLLSWGITGATTAATLSFASPPATAAASNRPSSLFVVSAKNATSVEGLQNQAVNIDNNALSSEICLLKLLPVKNKVFRELENDVVAISVLRTSPNDASVWKDVNRKLQSALNLLDSKRSLLQPQFNPDDSAMVQIAKGERGEERIEEFRSQLVMLLELARSKSLEDMFSHQKMALLALADIGELLVRAFPYEVPSEGKFSYLPRLLGRARVTFGFKRGNEFLGNVTVVADGFLAPITAGNFVDLSLRQFYTGLPIKTVKKRFSTVPSTAAVLDDLLAFDLIEEKLGIDDSGPDTVILPIMGGFQEGFYDPLTGKPRRIPLEVVTVDDKASGSSKLSYSEGFTDLSTEASLESSSGVQPLLSFDIPGLVSWNHPDKNVNVGSCEFFSLQYDKIRPSKRKLFDGRYAPFGYIIDGYDVYQDLRAGDVIDSTTVGDWGQLNLVKIRGTSFSDAMQSDGEE